ncbi:unnamed protein product [Cyprideis torosa]|uniref:Palmitoyltransferase DHHC domain-containing protein n=1 Tax=Cyprideis torosa TaxID=163714 RepID=A0A7R8W8G5_9CRUS|nr:unnamed protein product [Cyprideis torosa]CAG0883187.1 unnamed protein product [Cyprideis torosa]
MRLISKGASFVRRLRSPVAARSRRLCQGLLDAMKFLCCNRFCLRCMDLFKWTPVVFIMSVVCWSYYAYVVILCVQTLDFLIQTILYLIGYHFFLLMFLWAYYQVCFTKSDPVPKAFYLSSDEMAQYLDLDSSGQQKFLAAVIRDRGVPVHNRSMEGKIRFCDVCCCLKPDRAHHCSLCRQCVLKLDHHCPWINNCVNWNNYKFFMLFLLYALCYCLYCAGTVFPYFMAFWSDGLDANNSAKFQILFIFFVALMFSISLSFLTSYHLYLIAKNRSTLEAFRAPVFISGADKRAYDLGYGHNFRQVFGESVLQWPWPIQTQPGNGIEYPVRSSALIHSGYDSMERGGGLPLQEQQPVLLQRRVPGSSDEHLRDSSSDESRSSIQQAVSNINNKFNASGNSGSRSMVPPPSTAKPGHSVVLRPRSPGFHPSSTEGRGTYIHEVKLSSTSSESYERFANTEAERSAASSPTSRPLRKLRTFDELYEEIVAKEAAGLERLKKKVLSSSSASVPTSPNVPEKNQAKVRQSSHDRWSGNRSWNKEESRTTTSSTDEKKQSEEEDVFQRFRRQKATVSTPSDSPKHRRPQSYTPLVQRGTQTLISDLRELRSASSFDSAGLKNLRVRPLSVANMGSPSTSNPYPTWPIREKGPSDQGTRPLRSPQLVSEAHRGSDSVSKDSGIVTANSPKTSSLFPTPRPWTGQNVDRKKDWTGQNVDRKKDWTGQNVDRKKDWTGQNVDRKKDWKSAFSAAPTATSSPVLRTAPYKQYMAIVHHSDHHPAEDRVHPKTPPPSDPGIVNQKTPTCLLLTPEGNFHSFGHEARDNFHDLNPELAQRWNFFDRFKMVLHHESNLTRDTTISTVTGRPFPAILVFSHSLRFLKDHALQEVSDHCGLPLHPGDIRWVITVPAIWKQAARQFMREAAVQAGMTAPDAPEGIMIALESEAASIYCRCLKLMDLVPEPSPVTESKSSYGFATRYSQVPMKPCRKETREQLVLREGRPGQRYMIVDCGGGTVDITVHEIVDVKGNLKEIHKASGGACGSIYVDVEFIRLLERIFGQRFMSEFRRNRAGGFIDLMNSFEARKRQVGPHKSTPCNISLPFSFMEFHRRALGLTVEAALSKNSVPGVRWSSQGMIRLDAEVMEELFRKSLSALCDHIQAVFEASGVGRVDYLFLVGGFADSLQLQHRVRQKFGRVTRVIIPHDAGVAVLRGAVLFGLDPSVVHIRRARMTYGVGILNHYIAGRHPEHIFDQFVKINDSVAPGEVIKRIYTPARPDQTTLMLHLYSSETDDVKFVTDPGVNRCGTLHLELLDPTIGETETPLRPIQVSFVLGDTEIRASALDMATGHHASAKIDFLAS